MPEEEFKERYNHYIPSTVEWGDMDAFQHVNNTVYFRYFERIRIDWFREFGFIRFMQEHKIGPILASTRCRFKVALEYPDSILVGTYISELQDDRFLMNYAIYSNKRNCIAAEGDGLIVNYDYNTGKKANIPAEIKTRLHDSINS